MTATTTALGIFVASAEDRKADQADSDSTYFFNCRISSHFIPTTTMASLAARSATQALRAASRRAPRALASASLRPAQAASYSLFTHAAAAKAARSAQVCPRFLDI